MRISNESVSESVSGFGIYMYYYIMLCIIATIHIPFSLGYVTTIHVRTI